jgi:tetratricopeptide (TPR) repeat protein
MKSSMLHRMLASPVSLVILVAAAQALAQDPPSQCPDHVSPMVKKDATALTLMGVACFEEGNYPRALQHYLEALDYDAPVTLLGAIGRALHEQGIYSGAKIYYEHYLRDAGQADGAPRIRERLIEVNEQMARDGAELSIRMIPADASTHLVLEDGSWYQLGKGPMQVSLRQGDYEIVFTHPDYYPRRVNVRLKSGQAEHKLDVELVPGGAAFDVTARQWRRAGATTMAVAAPVTAAGVTLLVLGHLTESNAQAYDPATTGHSLEARARMHDRANTFETWGIVSCAVGVTGLLAGGVMYAMGRPAATASISEEAIAVDKWRLLPHIAPGQVGFTLSW